MRCGRRFGVAAHGEFAFAGDCDVFVDEVAQVAEAAVFCGVFADEFFGENVGVQCVDDGVGLCKGYACSLEFGVAPQDVGGAVGFPLDVVGDAGEGGLAFVEQAVDIAVYAADEVYGLEGGVGFYDVLPGATAEAKRAAAGRNRLALSFPDLKKRFYERNYPEKSCK